MTNNEKMTALRFFLNIFINVCIYMFRTNQRERKCMLVIIKKNCLKIIFKMIH